MSELAYRVRRMFRRWEFTRPKFQLELAMFEEGWSLILFGLFIPLPFRARYAPDMEIMFAWGFTTCDSSIHLNWRGKCKVVHMPWEWHQVRHDVQRADGSFVPYVGIWEHDKEPDGRFIETYEYQYTLRSGAVQCRTAKVYVEERECRWLWMRGFRWLRAIPFPRRVSRAIDVEFSDEVGERTGSWKGGCIGCGYTMLPGETALQTLRRMERDRKF